MDTQQIKSRERVKQQGEVFTAPREVNAMLDLIPNEQYQNPLSTWLEPACGNGNFLVEVIKRKLAHCPTTEAMDIYALKVVSSLYAVDIMEDNVEEARSRILALLDELVSSQRKANFLYQARTILHDNIMRGDFLNDILTIAAYNWSENSYTVRYEPMYQGKEVAA